MSCPTCGAETEMSANFCRMCGRRLREVSAPVAPNPPDLARAFKKLFVGIAFLIIAFVPLAEGEPIMWWLLFPGIPMVVKGLRLLTQSNVAHSVQSHYQQASITDPTTPLPGRISSGIRVRPTGELAPPSVTENTTKLLDKKAAAIP